MSLIAQPLTRTADARPSPIPFLAPFSVGLIEVMPMDALSFPSGSMNRSALVSSDGSRNQVVGIDASTMKAATPSLAFTPSRRFIVANVVKGQPSRDGAVRSLPNDDVGSLGGLTNACSGVTAVPDKPSPFPAPMRAAVDMGLPAGSVVVTDSGGDSRIAVSHEPLIVLPTEATFSGSNGAAIDRACSLSLRHANLRNRSCGRRALTPKVRASPFYCPSETA